MLKDKSYEVVCSLGERCMVAHQLRLNNLCMFSNPFDWLVSGDLQAVIDILLTKGKNFFREENISVADREGENLMVTDLYNHLISIHDFPKDIPFDMEYDRFIEKYIRRMLRLLQLINEKDSVLFVRTNVASDEIETLFSLQQLNKNTAMDYLIINTVDTDCVRQIPSKYENVYIYEISKVPDVSMTPWMGNHKHWKEVLSQFSLIGYKNNWLDSLRAGVKNKTLVIWGAGSAGRKLVWQISTATPPVKIGWIVDRDPVKWGKIDDNLEVKDPSSLYTHSSDVIVLICMYGNTMEVKNSLKKIGFPEYAVMEMVFDGLLPVGIKGGYCCGNCVYMDLNYKNDYGEAWCGKYEKYYSPSASASSCSYFKDNNGNI